MAKPRVLVLGAGFAGLELATILSETLGEKVDLTLIDRSDAFVFGFSKLDVIFGLKQADEVRLPYRRLRRPGVSWRKEEILSIDPAQRVVTTPNGRYESDYLVVALGADYDLDQTPGLRPGGHEYYSVGAAEHIRAAVSRFEKGKALVAIASAPYKCPPAPSETVLLLDELLRKKGVRDACEITLVTPLPAPIPPSPGASQALLSAFRERGIHFVPGDGLQSIDGSRRTARLKSGTETEYDLLLAVPVHRAPEVVERAGMGPGGWAGVNPATLATKFPGVYAAGDVADLDVPMAGVFAQGQARVVAGHILADIQGTERPPPYDGAAACYIEFGRGEAGRADVAFPIDGDVTASFAGPSSMIYQEKRSWAAQLAKRWGLA
jgi:sulfide:quinone oxidoreductase